MSSEPRERTLEMDRVVNFSDGVFAIAATLLVLSIGFSLKLEQPDLEHPHRERRNLPAKFWRKSSAGDAGSATCGH